MGFETLPCRVNRSGRTITQEGSIALLGACHPHRSGQNRPQACLALSRKRARLAELRLRHEQCLIARLDSDARKRALVANACLGLELHAQLEEEIFYPALFAQDSDTKDLDRSFEEHDHMRSLSQRLRQMSPQDANYDGVFCKLIRTALHHIADEETTLLPLAEVRLKDQLRELGWKMTARRFELLKPHMGEAATTTVMTFPVLTGAAVAGLCMATWLLFRGTTRRA